MSRERIAGYLFVAPSLLHFLVFTVYLMLSSLVISTWTWDLLTPHREVGWHNFTTLLFHDPIFRTAFKNTIVLGVLTVVPGMILGLAPGPDRQHQAPRHLDLPGGVLPAGRGPDRRHGDHLPLALQP